MRADQIAQIAAWLAATDIGLLELRGPGQALRLRHDGARVEVLDGDKADAAAPVELATTTVTAASVGVFLHRHPLRQDALAAPGARVQAGQALGLLQIGSLLLAVPAPADGSVHELLAADGAIVGYGTPLVALLDATPC